MAYCYVLQNPSFEDLGNLKTIGLNCMTECFQMRNPNFVGLNPSVIIGIDLDLDTFKKYLETRTYF